MDERTAATGPGLRRARWLLFLFLLSVLLLGGRRGFFKSDGFVEYRAGEAIYHRGAIDLPPELAAGKRFILGRDGRAYSIFGIGSSLQFAAAIAADRALGRLTGDPVSTREGEEHPGFFATQANVPVVALTGVVLLSLLADLGLGLPAALLGALLGVLGTMTAVYATLSFDMALGNLFLLAATLFFLRACRGARASDGLLAGALLGAGLLTRVTTAIFLPVLGLHAVLAARAHGPGGFRRLLPPAAAFSAAVAAALLALAWYNDRRFGGFLNTGYTDNLVASRFDASLLESIPALLASPGRSIFLFSPLLLLALPGIPRLLRLRRLEGATILLMALVNLVFFAKNRNWANAFKAWGPRFQLTAGLLLAVPFGFWLERALGRARRGGRALWAAVLALAVALQAAFLAVHDPLPGKDLWSLGGSQVVRALARLGPVVGGAEETAFWWAGPWYDVPPLRALLWAAVATALVTGALLVREVRAGSGRDLGR